MAMTNPVAGFGGMMANMNYDIGRMTGQADAERQRALDAMKLYNNLVALQENRQRKQEWDMQWNRQNQWHSEDAARNDREFQAREQQRQLDAAQWKQQQDRLSQGMALDLVHRGIDPTPFFPNLPGAQQGTGIMASLSGLFGARPTSPYTAAAADVNTQRMVELLAKRAPKPLQTPQPKTLQDAEELRRLQSEAKQQGQAGEMARQTLRNYDPTGNLVPSGIAEEAPQWGFGNAFWDSADKLYRMNPIGAASRLIGSAVYGSWAPAENIFNTPRAKQYNQSLAEQQKKQALLDAINRARGL